MVQVRVAGVALDAAQQHVILLKPLEDLPGEGRILPIWIGAQEATSILVAVEGAPVPRPLAHDLMRDILDTLGATVDRVEVTRIDEGTYYADVVLDTPVGSRVVDARPSDAVALASRTGASIFVADEVLAEAGVIDTVTAEDEDGVPVDAEESVDEFKRFLEDVDPDDFRG
ncbi:bifunctional nuclease family protein [Microbacterium sp. NPDC077184]|uniref:bifunctional nuclease family protein n=1 Tax=Microbacterium sp. NPDC077184 TaxID=3154764 RepID=UPI00341FBCEF